MYIFKSQLLKCTERGSYIIEVALLLPILVSFCLGLSEALNIARAKSAINEAINFGNRELSTITGRGVVLHEPESKQKFDWIQYRKVGNAVQQFTIARNTNKMPATCTISDSVNIGCSRHLSTEPNTNTYNTMSFDGSKVLNNFVNPELLVSRLPEANFSCKNNNKRGCITSTSQHLPAQGNQPERYKVQVTYNVPTPFLGFLIGKNYVTLTSSSTRTLETQLEERDPIIINGDLKDEYGSL